MMFSTLLKQVKIVEVGPRDGLQNEPQPISTQDKVAFIRKLIDAGSKHIELTSFVRPDKIPQLSDAEEVVKHILKLNEDVQFSCLVPNMKGMELACKLGVKEIAVFTATSETFSQKNTHAGIEEIFLRFEPVMALAKAENMKVRGYVSTVFGCPYEGKTSVETLLSVIKHLFDMGAYEVSLGDTTGIGTPLQVQTILQHVLQQFPQNKIAMHFHDTRGMAIANILVALEMGITSFDASAGGLGGCPYAKGASGNVATEDVVYLLGALGIKTGINLEKLADASQFILSILEKNSPSKVHQELCTKKAD